MTAFCPDEGSFFEKSNHNLSYQYPGSYERTGAPCPASFSVSILNDFISFDLGEFCDCGYGR
jgi:hypothetical protein